MAPAPTIVLAQTKSSWPCRWPQNSFHASSRGLKRRDRKGRSDNCTSESGVNETYFLQGGGRRGRQASVLTHATSKSHTYTHSQNTHLGFHRLLINITTIHNCSSHYINSINLHSLPKATNTYVGSVFAQGKDMETKPQIL